MRHAKVDRRQIVGHFPAIAIRRSSIRWEHDWSLKPARTSTICVVGGEAVLEKYGFTY